MTSVFSVDKNGVKYIDTGEDNMLDELEALFGTEEKKNMEQSDSLRDKRMAGLPVKRNRNK